MSELYSKILRDLIEEDYEEFEEKEQSGFREGSWADIVLSQASYWKEEDKTPLSLFQIFRRRMTLFQYLDYGKSLNGSI